MKPYHNGRVELHAGDCVEVLAGFEADSFDACVTDPPYGLQFMGREWDKLWRNGTKADVAYVDRTAGELTSRARKLPDYSSMARGPQMQEFHQQWAEQVLRVLKPGAHLVAFSGTRTYHRMACAIEDAGFEIRDAIMWHYGSGFPKSHDISKAIDRAAGAERTIIASGDPVKRMIPGADQHKNGWEKNNGREFVPSVTAPNTSEAQQWQGWGTALKPATEILCLARKPLSEHTVAANVLRWGSGALNIDGCRIPSGTEHMRGAVRGSSNGALSDMRGQRDFVATDSPLGRWPANLVHDGSEEVVSGFPADRPGCKGPPSDARAGGDVFKGERGQGPLYADDGSAARFFYTAKADADDRIGSKHPTVKPLDLIQWLCRLITPPRGTILDPFAGTGTTAEAALREGFRCTLIEREAEYLADIDRRMSLVFEGETGRSVAMAKLKPEGGPLPLFEGLNA